MNLSLAKLTAIVTAVMTAAVIVAGLVSISVSNQNRVIMGVQADGVTLAGLTESETRAYFTRVAQTKLAAKAAVLTYGEQVYTISPEEIDLHGCVDEATAAAYSIGRRGSLPENIINQLRCALVGANVHLVGAYDEAKLTARLNAIKASIDREPVSAVAWLEKGIIKRKPQVTGLALDIAPIEERLAPDLNELRLTPQVALEPVATQPAVMDSDLAALDTILASYTTSYTPGDRGDNIALAASHLQGLLVRPQAIASFNDTVGARTYAAGYKNAGVIVDGEPAVDVGGGVCQVSSTLYNAVLLAGLTPRERSSHFLPSHYVPAGRDATVADGLLDFKFQNNLPHAVYIRIGNTGRELTIYVLGTRADLGGQSIALETSGDAANPSLYRLWKKDGALLNKEFLHTDHYTSNTN